MAPFDLARLVRPAVARMTPYSSARDEFQGQAQVMLDANENPFDTGFNRYPDPLQHDLKLRIVAHRTSHWGIAGLSEQNLFLGNGSDEGIDLMMRAFCPAGQGQVIVQPPTYGMYEVAAALQEAVVVSVPLGAGMTPDYPALEAAVNEHTRLVFFCSPNNPTGNALHTAPLLAFARRCPALVVVDEAYVEFALAENPDASVLAQLSALPNLVVLQTFSKAVGQAGIRMGMLWAAPEVIAVINKIKAPYNISTVAQQAATNALDYSTLTQQLVTLLVSERRQLSAALAELPYVDHVFPSDANFLLVRFDHSRRVYDHLAARGIVVRDRSRQHGCAGCLRISVGTPEENARLIAALAEFTPAA